MGRIPSHWYALLMLLFIPRSSSAIQLEWGSGSTSLSFTSATRCTLVVRADSAEARLPSEWRLLWATDSCDVRPLALPSETACQQEAAEVSVIDEPATGSDSLAHMPIAHFCSAGSVASTTAHYILDLPAGTRGRLKVVALDSSDPRGDRVVQTNEVVFNGGVSSPYPPSVLRTTSVHRSTEFRLDLLGVGLGDVTTLSLAAPDGSWQQSLDIKSQSDTAIAAGAALAANVPECVLRLESSASSVATASVAADPLPPSAGNALTGACLRGRFEESYPGHAADLIQPRDFAFVLGGWTPVGTWAFHLFYGRLNQYSSNTEKNIGHAVSDSLTSTSWVVLDTAAVRTRGAHFDSLGVHPSFDSLHVWAPSITLKGLTYHMFYTGVDKDNSQRIGLATSTDLVHWTQRNGSVLDAATLATNDHWLDPAPAGYSQQAQLRDPFVMQDPDVPGDWLMYFVTVPTKYTPDMVVGVARSHGDLATWESSFPLWNTHHHWSGGSTYYVESVHAFERSGKWWLFYTVDHDSVWVQSNPTSPSDPDSTHWSQVQKLTTVVPPAQADSFLYWHATEYLQVSDVRDIEYLAAWNDLGVEISYTQMRPASAPYLFSMDCPSVAGVSASTPAVLTPRLQLTSASPARSRVDLRIHLPSKMRAHVAVFDVMGRRLATLVDGSLPGGATDVHWDGRDRGGAEVGSGVYFARLTTTSSHQAVRIALIR